jgi:hypothetical protein
LGFWFDRKLKGVVHAHERSAGAMKVAGHVRGLSRMVKGPPESLRKAVDSIVTPMVTYAAESWYKGPGQRQGSLEDEVNNVMVMAARAVAPAYCTAPKYAVLRDACLPSGRVALETARLRHAFRLKTADEGHLLVKRQVPELWGRGPNRGRPRPPRTRLQKAAALLPDFPRPLLLLPHFSEGSTEDPTGGRTKEEAAEEHRRMPYARWLT